VRGGEERLDPVERVLVGIEPRDVGGDRGLERERVVRELQPARLLVGLLEHRDPALELPHLHERVAAHVGAEHREVQEARLVGGLHGAQGVARSARVAAP